MDLKGQVDHVGLPIGLEEDGSVGGAVGLRFGRGRFDFDELDRGAADADHVGAGHQVAMGERGFMEHPIARADTGERAGAGLGRAFAGDIEVVAGVVDPDQFLEHVAPFGEQAHVLVVVGTSG